MCGIAGIIEPAGGRPADAGVVEAMCRAIHHRGPDDRGVWHEGRAAVGMTRLSIIDRAGGHQPMSNEDGDVIIVFNGEIYNHVELRRELEAAGHRFGTRADTEVIVHLYEEAGDACVERLRGMFAFAIWDARRQRLLVARDRLGIKPLHWTFQDGRLLFGSEIKCLLAAGVPREIDAQAVVEYTGWGYVPAPRTMFAGVRKLPPAHRLIFENGEPRVERWWDVRYAPDPAMSEREAVDRTIALVEESVAMRLMSEVPLGAFLSGGTDSSVVVAAMTRRASEPVRTFSIGFEYERFNELGYARAVAEHFGTRHHEHVVRENVVAGVPDLLRQFDEPFADSSAIPTYWVSRIAREQVTVALSGDGGDELFAGYHRFFDGAHVRAAGWIPRALRDGLVGGLVRSLPDGAPGIERLRDVLGTPDEQYLRRVTHGVSSVHDRLFTREFAERVESTDPACDARSILHSVRHLDVISRRQYLDTRTFLCDDILCKVDRMSMAVSLEARVPLLDHRLVEFAAAIPPVLHTRAGETKHVLREAARRLMPAHLVDRPKHGFGIPLGEWIRGPWAGWARELIGGQRFLRRGIYAPGAVARMLEEHGRGRRDWGSAIWRLMVLEFWIREQIEGERVDPPGHASGCAR